MSQALCGPAFPQARSGKQLLPLGPVLLTPSLPSAPSPAFASTTSPGTVATQHPAMNQDGAAEEVISLDGVSCLNHTFTPPPS